MADTRVVSTYRCKAKTQDACRREFLKEHPQLEYVKVDGDGNCFFRSIAAYYKRTGQKINGVRNPTDYHELRQYIVGRLREQIYADEELHMIMTAMNERPLEMVLDELAKTCVWNVPAFEMMVERVPIILNVNLRIYKINHEDEQYTITEALHTPYDRLPVGTTISIFLASNHYGLIYSNRNNNNTRRKRQENMNMNAAIAASIQTAENAAYIKQMKNNANFAEQLHKLEINSKKSVTRRKPTVGVLPVVAPVVAPAYNSNSSNVSNASNASSIASFNGFNIENAKNQYPFKTTTIKDIKEMLHVYGIEYDSKAKKEELYGEFIMAFVSNINQRTKNKLQKNKQAVKYNSKVASRKAARNARRASMKK
jgi:hypothetical protein